MKKVLLVIILIILFIKPIKYETVNSPSVYYLIDSIHTIDTVLSIIKYREGLFLTKYLCPANYSTIGYGHRVYDTLSYIDSITAEVLLLNDFLNTYNSIDLEISSLKKLVLTSLVLNIGISAFNKSKLKRYLKNNDSNYKKEWLEWVYFRSNGKYIESRNLKISREKELYLYELKK